MLFKGTERFPKGQIDRLAFARGRPVQRRDRRGLHALLVRLPVRPLGAGPGDRGRPDARRAVRPARGRGRAAGDRRGAGPRPRFAPGPARPDPPGRHLPPAPLSQPDPGLARRPRADRRRRPASVLPGALPARRRRAGRRRRRRPRRGPGPDRRPLRAICPRAIAAAAARRSTSRGRRAGATSRWSSPSRRRAACSAGTPCRAGIATGRPSTSSPTCSACGRRSRLWDALVETDRTATWVEAAQAAAQRAGQFLIQVEAVAGHPTRPVERRSPTSSSGWPTTGPTPEELARSRHRLEAAWRWEQEDLAAWPPGSATSPSGATGGPGRPSIRAALAVEADDIRRVAVDLPGRRQPDGRLVAAQPAAERGRGRRRIRPTPSRRPSPLPSVRSPVPRPARRPAIAAPPETARRRRSPGRCPPGISRLADYRPRRTVLANGLRLVSERRPGTGVVALELFVDAGLLREAKPGLAYLTGRLLEEGTATRPADELAEAIEDVGGTLDVGSTGRSLRVRAEDLPWPWSCWPTCDRGRLPGRGARPGRAADRRRAPGRPRRPGLPRRADLPRPGLRRPSLGPRPAGRRPRDRPADARRRRSTTTPPLRAREHLPRRRRRLRSAPTGQPGQGPLRRLGPRAAVPPPRSRR